MNYGAYRAHHATSWFPLMDDSALDELTSDILENGQLEPCVVWGALMVDGRNRWVACRRAGIEPTVASREFEDDDHCIRWVLSENLHRRHLTPSQRAMVAVQSRAFFQSEARKRMVAGRSDPNRHGGQGQKWEDAAGHALGVSGDSVRRAADVESNGSQRLRDSVRAGAVSVRAAAELARELPAPEQDAILDVGPDLARDVAAAIRRGDRSALHSSASNEWYTPAIYVDAARNVLGSIDLDPASCAVANEVVGANAYFDATSNGLEQPWNGRVFMNPPYGRDGVTSNQRVWSQKLIDEYDSGRVTEAIMLVNAATDTAWFRPLWSHAICFVDHRIRFAPPDGMDARSPTHASVFVYFGANVATFREVFRQLGPVAVPSGDVIATFQQEISDSPG